MKRETRRYIRDLAYFSSIGFQIVLSILIGLFGGKYLDEKVFNTTPWLTYIGFFLGVGAAISNLMLAIKKLKKL